MSKREAAFLAAAAAAMACLHLAHFGLPPLQPDETSLPFMALPLLGEPSGEYEDYAKGLAGGAYLGPFPVYYGPYIGVLGGYASLPFQWALGPSTDAIRAYSAFSTILIQVSLYFATREFFSARAAGIATALFTAFPLVVFYSRQSMTYDWIVLALALCVLYFGMRFFRGGSLWNLCAAVSMIGIMLWAYLFTAWFVLGVLAMLPVCAAALRARAGTAKLRLAAALSASAAAGAIPLALQHAMSPHDSPGALLLRTVSGDSAMLASDNWDLIHNLHLRSTHLYEVLTRPHHGFAFAVLEYGWHPFDPTFFALFAASAAFGAVWVACRMEGWRRAMGVLVVLAVMFFASMFTVSFVSIMQLGIMLPFVFMLVGGSLDKIIARTCGSGRAAARCGLVAAGVVAAVAAVQAPVMADMYSQLAGEPHSQYMHAVDGLDSYLSDSGLVPVEMDFWTRSMFFMMDGGHVPIKVRVGADIGTGFDQDSRDAMLAAEDVDLVRTDVAFVIYAYPELLDCGTDMDASMIPLSNQCAQAYFVESAAERNGLDVVVRDFGLPDGTPYWRTLRMVPADPGA